MAKAITTPEGLSPDDLETIDALAYGATYAQAGQRLGLTKWGVRKRLERICSKVGARNRAHLLAILSRAGGLGDQP